MTDAEATVKQLLEIVNKQQKQINDMNESYTKMKNLYEKRIATLEGDLVRLRNRVTHIEQYGGVSLQSEVSRLKKSLEELQTSEMIRQRKEKEQSRKG